MSSNQIEYECDLLSKDTHRTDKYCSREAVKYNNTGMEVRKFAVIRLLIFWCEKDFATQ